MAALVVVDSGVLLASVMTETYSAHAQAQLKAWKRGKITLAAPTLLHYEVVAATRKFVYQKRLTEAEGVTVRETLLGYGLKLYHDKALLRRAYELATQLNRPTAYASQYLALAERLDTEF